MTITDPAHVNHLNPWILTFSSPEAAAETTGLLLAGGKGANLARMTQAGFPVPPGFLISTQAYRDFTSVNQLDAVILSTLNGSDDTNLDALEAVSQTIRARFAASPMPEAFIEALLTAYRTLGGGKVAVRSSATAEDLPEMSFAGQQDTYLNVMGEASLIDAVMNCWSSLWTARAIGYRRRNHLPPLDAALAVVVQRMVESQASGVLFTANPLTGLRSETVIDATIGLGEALVSGRVEPDHYVVDAASGQIVSKALGAKALSIHGQAGGGTTEVSQERSDHQALPDPQILALSRLGQQVAEYYHSPQDIEWAWAEGQLFLLQSRAITSLFPVPDGINPEPLKVFFSFAAVQGMLDPLTPLGRDLLKMVFAAGAGLYGIKVSRDNQRVLYPAGERLWVNITTLLRNTVGRRIFYAALDFIEPTIKQAVTEIYHDPRLAPERKGIRLKALSQIARVVIPGIWNIVLNLASPRRRREMIIARSENILERVRSESAARKGDPHTRLAYQINLMERAWRENLPNMFILFVSAVAAGMAAFNWLRVLAKTMPERNNEASPAGHWPSLVLEMTRGLPYNPTTEMDLALWAAAQAIQSSPEARQDFGAYTPHELAGRWRSGELSPAALAIINPFIERYGGRGLGEIDLGRPRWFEDPTHIFEVLGSYLQINDIDRAPDVVFAHGVEAASAAVDQLVTSLRQTHLGWFKSHLARFAASRVRELMGIRERPKFFVVRLMAQIRRELLNIGAEMVEAGELHQADDLFYLSMSELQALAAGENHDWLELIRQRREVYNREMLRRQIPRLLLSDGRAFYEGMRSAAADTNTLVGSPVSPGSAEGSVRVVLDPRQAHLQPGEIMVCPGTDPSWTPLFLSAGGLIMEVGGMMTHGAVVAREYGIPAVVGVDQVTRKLVTGQRVRVNGSTGQIDILE